MPSEVFFEDVERLIVRIQIHQVGNGGQLFSAASFHLGNGFPRHSVRRFHLKGQTAFIGHPRHRIRTSGLDIM